MPNVPLILATFVVVELQYVYSARPLKQARATINFKLDIQKVPDPEGGHRAVTTLDGKHLPTKPL